MGSYAQWRSSVDTAGVRRITWVCGDQPVLVEEIVDHTRTLVAADPLDTVSVTAGTVPDPDVWAATHQYPVQSGAHRLVLVRDAGKIRQWEPLRTWLAQSRRLPGVHLLFLAGTPDLAAAGTPAGQALATLKARPRLALIVKATRPSPDDLHAWLKRRAPALSDYVAAHLLARVGGDLTAAAQVAAKLVLFDVTASTSTIDALAEDLPADSFTDCLLAGDKRHALHHAQVMAAEDTGRVLGLLDQRLDLLVAVHRGLRDGHRPQDCPGVNPYLARRYADLAKHYEPRRVANLRTVLAVVDTALRNGARTGLLETLVALW